MRRPFSVLCLLMLSSVSAFAGDPSQISGLDGWWRADTGITTTSGFVSQWNDQSGNGFNLTQATAANRPAAWPGGAATAGVAFEYYTYGVGAPSEFMSIPAGLSTNQQSFSFFAVVDWNSVNSTQLLFGAPSSSISYLHNSTGFLAINTGSAKVSTLRTPSSRCLVGTTCNGTNSIIYLNGASYSTTSFGAGTVTGGYLGSWNSGSTTVNPKCNILAAWHFNRALSTTDELNLLDYASQTYQFQTSHNVVVVFDGDSITAGQGTSYNQSYVKQIGLASNYKYYNWGLAGQQLSAMVTNAAANIDPNLDTTKDYNILVLFGGTNDMAATVGNQTAATAYSRLTSYVQARISAGWTPSSIIVVTCLPRTGNGGSGGTFEADRTAYNTLVRNGATTYGYTVADVGADSIMGNSSNLSNTLYYNSDQIHPTATGAAIIARYVRKAINTIVNPPTLVPVNTHY